MKLFNCQSERTVLFIHTELTALKHEGIRLFVQQFERWQQVKSCQVRIPVQAWVFVVCRIAKDSYFMLQHFISLFFNILPIFGSTFYYLMVHPIQIYGSI